MPDLLVNLQTLPALEPALAEQRAHGTTIRRAHAYEYHRVLDWVQATFEPGWASECAVAFARQPIACWIAERDAELVGFACYEATHPNFFGPTGVDARMRGQGVGTALLLATLHAMHSLGYVYAVIGDAGPVDFYARTVGAWAIPAPQAGAR